MQQVELFQPGFWFQLGIARKIDNILIGDIGIRLMRESHEAEIGFSLSREEHGKGLATEAITAAVALIFECTAVPAVVAITDTRNIAAMHLLQKLGFVCMRSERTLFRGEVCIEQRYLLSRP